MARRQGPVLALVSVALVTGSAAACGMSDNNDRGTAKTNPSATASPSPTTPAFARKPGGSIVLAGMHAMSYIGQARFSGSVIADGDKYEMNVRRDVRGNCSGVVTQGEVTSRFVITRTASYVKGNAEFWRQTIGEHATSALAYLDGRWARVGASKDLERLCDVRVLMSWGNGQTGTELVGPDPKVSAVQQFDGQDAVEVTGDAGEETYRFLVEVDAPHRIFRLNTEIQGESGELTFDYGDDALVTVPRPEDSVAFDD